jgi:hypothetical protein
MLLFLVIKAILLCFCVIRIDHILLDLRICSIGSHKGACGKNENEQADHEKGQEDRSEPDHKEEHATDCGKHDEIAAKAKQTEDYGIFDDLEERKLKRNHNVIEIKTDKRIEHNDQKHRPEQEIISCVIDVIAHQRERAHSDDHKIKNTHGKRLLPVSLDGGDKILPQENGLTLDKVLHKIRASRVYGTKGEDKERRNGIQNPVLSNSIRRLRIGI